MSQCEKLGIKGIKLDHIESESQFIINLYRKFLEEAANHRLMVLYHNPQKPTGLSRTYPNLMSMEAIRGMQCRCDPDDTTILPFTRMVAGDADYTPLCYTVPARRGDATLGHILATTVIIISSFMTISEEPLTVKKEVFADFIRGLPTVWDETIVVPQSKIGETAVFARRKDASWYLAALSSLRCQRELIIALDFLSADTIYDIELFEDDDADRLKVNRTVLSSVRSDSLSLSIAPGGGFAAKFTIQRIEDHEI